MNVIPRDDILHARSHGGTDGEDKALLKGPAQQAQHTVPLWAVGEVGHAVSSWVPNTWVRVFWLLAMKVLKQDQFKRVINGPESIRTPSLRSSTHYNT